MNAAEQIADEYGVESLGQQLDVTDRDATIAAFNAVSRRLGVPQVLVTAAGIEINNDSVKVTADEWRKVIDVNSDRDFFSAQAFGSGLLQAGLPGSAIPGSLVNVGIHRERASMGSVL